MKWQLCGPIDIAVDEETMRKAFAKAKRLLYVRGASAADIWSPPEHVPSGMTAQCAAAKRIAHIAHGGTDIARGVGALTLVTLPKWEKSASARLEVEVAKAVGVPVVTFEDAARMVGA